MPASSSPHAGRHEILEGEQLLPPVDEDSDDPEHWDADHPSGAANAECKDRVARNQLLMHTSYGARVPDA